MNNGLRYGIPFATTTNTVTAPVYNSDPTTDAMNKLEHIEKAMDEFDIMRAISKLDDVAKKRILVWLNDLVV
jgi:hypothetical protein